MTASNDTPSGKPRRQRSGAKGSAQPKGASTSKPAEPKAAEPKAAEPKAPTEAVEVRPVPTSRNAFEAGAARATGERRRRSGTPLLSAPGPVELSAARRRASAAEHPPEPLSETPTESPPDSTGDDTTAAPARRRPPRKAIRERREERAKTRALRPVPSPVDTEPPATGPYAADHPPEVPGPAEPRPAAYGQV